MRYKFIFAVILLLPVSGISFSQLDDPSPEDVKGKVRSLTFTTYEVIKHHGKKQRKAQSKYIYNFDEKGYLTSIENYDANGRPGSATTYRYNKQHLCVEENTVYSDSSLSKRIIKYNKQNLLVEEYEVDRDGTLSGKRTITYNEKRLKTEENEYGRNNLQYHKSTYKYDPKGNRTELNNYWYKNTYGYHERTITRYNKLGKELLSVELKADKGGKLDTTNIYYHRYAKHWHEVKRFVVFRSGRTLWEHFIYKYNNIGKLTEYYLRTPGGDPTVTYYKYDSNNNLIEEIYLSDSGRKETKAVLRYTAEKQPCEELIYENGMLAKKCTFKFQDSILTEEKHFQFNKGMMLTRSFKIKQIDEKGNWLFSSKYEYDHSPPRTEVERQIEYYEVQ